MRKLGLASLLPALVAGSLAACGGATDNDDPANTTSGGTSPGGTSPGGTSPGGTSPGGSGGSAGTPVTIETPGEPQELVCVAETVSLTSGLNPTVQTDFLGLYMSTAQGPGALAAVGLYEAEGTLCSGASDLPACEAEAAAIDTEQVGIHPDYWGPHYVFVYTKGDEVGFIYDSAALVSFLGTIDTPNEAAAVLWSIGRAVGCGSINEDETGYFARGSWQVSDCPFTDQELLLHVARDGSTEQTEVGERVVTSQGCAGRRPTCLVAAEPSRARSALGRYFAGLAHLESAAVVAFAILERELGERAAPPELLEAARKAMGDEVRHAEIMGRLAQRFSARPAPVELKKRAKRSLLEIALENAIEGCVRETYGALQAHYQATAADDPEVRSAWASIAPEETEHAELSHALHRWLMPQLSEDERRQVEQAVREALATLRSELATEQDPELVAGAGVPDADQAMRLLQALEQALFSTVLERSAA